MTAHKAVRWTAAFAGLVAAFAVTMAWSHRTRPPVRLVFTREAGVLPADGDYHRALDLRRSDGEPLVGDDLQITGLQARPVPGQAGSIAVDVQAPTVSGTRRLWLHGSGLAPASATIRFIPSSSDRFEDGTPEFLRLHTAADRRAFRAWFTALADTAATLPPRRLPSEIDDCAALLRWCYRNALHAHDEAWQAAAPFATPPPLPSIQQYAWPDTPLGANLFRVKAGAYAPGDAVDGSFAQFADARTLMQRNAFFVSRDLRAALPGDLLFYRQLGGSSPYHSMMLTGSSAQWAVYHTGPMRAGTGPTRGEVRRVLVRDLLHHPDRQWRPEVDNQNFLGVYRWNILRQDP